MIVPICEIYMVLTSHHHQGSEWLGFLTALIRCGAKREGSSASEKLAPKHQNRIFLFITGSMQKIPHTLCQN